MYKTKKSFLITGISDDLTKQNLSILTGVTAMDLPDNITIILKENESLYHPNNKYTFQHI